MLSGVTTYPHNDDRLVTNEVSHDVRLLHPQHAVRGHEDAKLNFQVVPRLIVKSASCCIIIPSGPQKPPACDELHANSTALTTIPVIPMRKVCYNFRFPGEISLMVSST